MVLASFFGALNSRTGGIRYHARAWRQQATRWALYRRSLGRWLAEWSPPESNLIIVGASGGYCLESQFLLKFEVIYAVDPDPLAPWFFRRQHPEVAERVRWIRDPVFDWSPESRSVDRWHEFLDAHAKSAVLFSGLLGQLRFLSEAADECQAYAQWRGRLAPLLEGRSWASFHDRLSGERAPHFEGESGGVVRTAARLSDAEVLQRFYLGALGSESTSPELLDHLTDGLLPASLPHAYFKWEIVAGYSYLIEAVARRRDSP